MEVLRFNLLISVSEKNEWPFGCTYYSKTVYFMRTHVYVKKYLTCVINKVLVENLR